MTPPGTDPVGNSQPPAGDSRLHTTRTAAGSDPRLAQSAWRTTLYVNRYFRIARTLLYPPRGLPPPRDTPPPDPPAENDPWLSGGLQIPSPGSHIPAYSNRGVGSQQGTAHPWSM